MSIIVSPIPEHYRAQVDDAAIFPPGNAALPQAVSAHHEHQNASYAVLRTGGATGDSFPSSGELAACIAAALDRELPFKCTAGLHNALRHRDDESGFEHHGFLNVLLATRASIDETGSGGLVSARRWFTSFGSCSVLEPLQDLVELDLLPDLQLESA